MTSSTRPSAPPSDSPGPGRRRVAPFRAVAAILLALLGAVVALGTVRFGLLLADPPLVGWSVVAFAGLVVLGAALPGLLRGRRVGWMVALCWTAALLYWALYKVLVEGEAESLVGVAALSVVLVLLVVPAGRPAPSAGAIRE